jgi:hypothetical protein
MLDYNAAKELAQHVADAEAKHLDPHESYVIVDDLSHEHPWGWIFEPAIEPYRSTGDPCLRGGAWCLSVDRFSGKIQTSSWAGWRADHWPILELHLIDAGSTPNDLYHFLRQYKGWTATETRYALRKLPCIIAAGAITSMTPVSKALVDRGATVELRQKHA